MTTTIKPQHQLTGENQDDSRCMRKFYHSIGGTTEMGAAISLGDYSTEIGILMQVYIDYLGMTHDDTKNGDLEFNDLFASTFAARIFQLARTLRLRHIERNIPTTELPIDEVMLEISMAAFTLPMED